MMMMRRDNERILRMASEVIASILPF